MFDFAITNTGDLIFAQSQNNNKELKLSFNINRLKGLRLSFNVDECYPGFIEYKNETSFPIDSKNGLILSFDIKMPSNNKKAILVQGNEALYQYIKVIMRTAVNELTMNKPFGSKLELFKHGDLNDKSLLNIISNSIKTTLSNIISDVRVDAKPLIDKNKGYEQCLNIYIYNSNNELIFRQSL